MTFTSYSKVFNQATGIVTFTITATKEQGAPKETRQLTLLRKRIDDNSYIPVGDKVSIEIEANETQKSVELVDSTKTFWPQATYLYQITGKESDNDPVSIYTGIPFSWVLTSDLLLMSQSRALTLAYNPEISSMKIVTGDAITQTLGSRYPYFRRNGMLNYKQFTIGGLISYSEDNDFAAYDHAALNTLNNTADREIVKEALFREQVLDFLYDNQPKVLKSTTEGCMIVKLSNISLTPNKQLGRMLYSFTAQATEYAEPTFENLMLYSGGNL